MSKIAEDVYSGIKVLFPYETIVPEYYVYYKNNKLFFDFFIKSLNICIECQGRQHFQFVKHFHSDIQTFYDQKRRDTLKVDYCNSNDLTLVYFYDNIDIITNELILKRIYEAIDD